MSVPKAADRIDSFPPPLMAKHFDGIMEHDTEASECAHCRSYSEHQHKRINRFHRLMT